MSKHQATIDKAIETVLARGARLSIGCPAATKDEPVTMVLAEINGDTGILEWQGRRVEAPLAEIFDPNEVRDVAVGLSLSDMMNSQN